MTSFSVVSPFRFQKSSAARISLAFSSTHWPRNLTSGVFSWASASSSRAVMTWSPNATSRFSSSMVDNDTLLPPCICGVFTLARMVGLVLVPRRVHQAGKMMP